MSMVDNQIIKQYLLNTLSERDRIGFEIQYFEDDHLYQWLLMIEEELITDYAYDRLTANERRLFDEHYSVTPERRKRIESVIQFLLDILVNRNRHAFNN